VSYIDCADCLTRLIELSVPLIDCLSVCLCLYVSLYMSLSVYVCGLCVSGFVKYKRANNQYRTADERLKDWDEIYNHPEVMSGIQRQAAR